MASGRSHDLRHFTEILDTLDAIVWEADAATVEFTYVNEAVTKILGYPPKEWIARPGFWESLIHPEDREHTIAFCREASRAGRDHEFDYRAVRADGSIVWIHDVVRVVTDDQGAASLLRGVMTDITHLKEVEARRTADMADLRSAKEELAQSEERYRLLSELTSDYAWSVTVTESGESRLEWATGAFERITGYEIERIGGNWRPIIHPDDLPVADHAFTMLAAGQTMDVDLRIVRSDGKTVWIRALARPVLDAEGKVARIVGGARDVTERKVAEQELAASEARFRAVFDRAPVGIATADLDGRLLLLNQAILDLTGYPVERLRAMRFSDLTHPDDVDRDWELYRELQAGERTHYEIDKRYIRMDGETIWAHVFVSLIRDDEGQPLSGVAVIEDITAKKQAAEDRDDLHRQLLQSQKMEAIGRLAGGVAHDFNNILAAVLNYAAFIEENPEDSESVRADAGEIISAGKRAAALTRQLLMFSRRETPQLELLDLREVVTDHAKFLERTLGENIELKLELAPNVECVLADRLQVEQILLNLAVNSKDAMPRGGNLTISVQPAGASEVKLRVKDTGPGMSSHIRSKAFEPFFTTKPAGQGTGLGLATVYGIAERLGGTAEIEPTEGTGACVCVTLPASAEEGDSREVLDPKTRPNRSLRILLVEDEDQLRTLVSRMLRLDGHQVIEAATAQETVGLGEQLVHSVDLLLTDVVLPGLSGIELARSLRAERADLQVLYMSGYPADVIEAQGGIDAPLLEKPFTTADLRRAIARTLETA